MKKQHTLAVLVAWGASLAHSGVALAEESQDHHLPTQAFKVAEIKPQFHFLQGKGGNVLAVTGDEGILIVDSDYQDMSKGLEDALAELPGELEYIINTHWHGDHTQGNKILGKTADIIAHENVYKRLSTRQEVKLFNMISDAYPEHALPDLTYDKRMTVRHNGQTVRLMHYPQGHTDGDSVVWFEEANVVHMGDLFFNGFYPFVDVDSGGSVLRVAQNVQQVEALIDEDTSVVPGHGPLARKAELTAFREMLEGTSQEVKELVQAGMSLEAVQKQGLSDRWDEWEDGFLNESVWIAIVYNSLMQDNENLAIR